MFSMCAVSSYILLCFPATWQHSIEKRCLPKYQYLLLNVGDFAINCNRRRGRTGSKVTSQRHGHVDRLWRTLFSDRPLAIYKCHRRDDAKPRQRTCPCCWPVHSSNDRPRLRGAWLATYSAYSAIIALHVSTRLTY